ncbi:hypothetical protein D6T64_14140 [Cryobacterium melibiosiphilum]|uniref:SAF domain-containing protein n=1 Tax=Cryobacterium melibiosiphilum TaxID=995039 RepID=A0A3A5ME99_9MICO|nr:hypothetical protein [Cryobacterium melibiosiphilum]RJT87455.1 hypothetical protein D6T64_14140 [Cryobacterium melibiosiphilum]
MTRPGNSTRKRFWVDPRFAVGLVLVVASVAGVSAVVVRAERTTTVYAAGSALIVGDRLHAADLVLLDVRLDSAADLYLTPDQLPAEGVLVTRTVVEGELVPASAVGAVEGELLTSLVVTLRGLLSESVTAGSVVDVWAAPQEDNARFAPPGILVPGATVVRLVENTGMLTSTQTPMVEILVPKSAVSTVLEAIANDDAVSIVAVNTDVDATIPGGE